MCKKYPASPKTKNEFYIHAGPGDEFFLRTVKGWAQNHWEHGGEHSREGNTEVSFPPSCWQSCVLCRTRVRKSGEALAQRPSKPSLTRGTLDGAGFALVPALLCLQADGVLRAWVQPPQQEGGAVHWDLHLTLLPPGPRVEQAVAVELGHGPPPAQGQGGLRGLADLQVLGVIKIYRVRQKQSWNISELPWYGHSHTIPRRGMA